MYSFGHHMAENAGDSSPRRQRTRRLVLGAIREHSGVTRVQLTRLTGLSRSATAEAVQDLLAQGLVTERRTDPTAGRGRPSTLLFPNAPPDGFVGAVDFGHSHVFAAVADTSGQILAEHCRSIDVDHRATDALDTAADLLARGLQETGLAAPDLASVAAGIPCPLDGNTGIVRSPTILAAWVDLDPARELAIRIGHPVHVDNDANMELGGSSASAPPGGCRNFIYVKASHGIGAGLVLGGQTYRGTLGIAGEIGHTQLPEVTTLCRCGNRGCLETVVSIAEVRRQLALVTRRAAIRISHPSPHSAAIPPPPA